MSQPDGMVRPYCHIFKRASHHAVCLPPLVLQITRQNENKVHQHVVGQFVTEPI